MSGSSNCCRTPKRPSEPKLSPNFEGRNPWSCGRRFHQAARLPNWSQPRNKSADKKFGARPKEPVESEANPLNKRARFDSFGALSTFDRKGGWYHSMRLIRGPLKARLPSQLGSAAWAAFCVESPFLIAIVGLKKGRDFHHRGARLRIDARCQSLSAQQSACEVSSAHGIPFRRPFPDDFRLRPLYNIVIDRPSRRTRIGTALPSTRPAFFSLR